MTFPPSVTLERAGELDRFFAFVSPEPNTGCWLWTGALQSKGYGFFCRADGSMVLAHRFSVELERGPIAEDLEVDHVCRLRACVNPEHLDAVTQSENGLRRYRAARGEPIRSSFRNRALPSEGRGKAGTTGTIEPGFAPSVHNSSTMETRVVAALFVITGGVYFGRPDVDLLLGIARTSCLSLPGGDHTLHQPAFPRSVTGRVR